MSLKNHTVLITGGNTGIGKEIALSFGSKGANVVINYIANEDSANDVITHIENLGGKAIKIYGDVTNLDDCSNMIKTTIEHFGKLDTLINNSGITKDGLLMRMEESDFDRVVDVNLKGTWNMCKASSRVFMKQREGAIINISSVVSLIGNAGQSNYVSSKAGINGLTKSLSKEFGSRNIRVNAVAPGFIETKMTEVLTDEVKENYLREIPLNRFGSPVDIANLCLFLASKEASYITGQIISVNGGMV
jgi:3-oxoacyl-[acyl-carrier protein] reductase